LEKDRKGLVNEIVATEIVKRFVSEGSAAYIKTRVICFIL